MPKARSPNRDKAYEIWLDSGGSIPLTDIASQIGVSDGQVRKWKNQDLWEEKIKGNVTIPNGNVTNQMNSNVTIPTKKKHGAQPGNKNAVGHGAPKGNKNAVGNNGGPPLGSQNALKHGFFSRIFPDDEETREIVESISIKTPLEMLWENIVIQYTAIARAQRLMFVRDKDDMTKVLKRHKVMESGTEKEWELQHAWDKHAGFLTAQSRAMKTLEGLIAQYDELSGEKRTFELDKLKAELDKLKSGNGNDNPMNITIKRKEKADE